MTEHATETRGIKIAFTRILNTSHSIVIRQALEMLSDVLISTFRLLSPFWSRKSADKFHIFG